jgi:hypothetical protein
MAAPVLPVATVGASAATGPSVTLRFASTSVEMKSPVPARVCGRNVPARSIAYVQERNANRVWKAVGSGVKLLGSDCAVVELPEPSLGKYAYRANLWVGKTLRFQTPAQGLTVYGPVDFATFCSSISSCALVNGTNSGALVQVGGHIDNYIDWICGSAAPSTTTTATTAPGVTVTTVGDYCATVGANEFPQNYTLNADNTCRSLTMSTAEVAQDNGATGGHITIAVLQHTYAEQTASPILSQSLTSKFKLDGGPIVVQFTNTGPTSLYVLSGSADCYTSSGTPTS